MMITKQQMRDADCEIAMECAHVAERDACQALVDVIESMCVNENQKTMAAALITASMIEKFEGTTIVTGPSFARTVEKLREKMKPETEACARKHRDAYQKTRSWMQQFSDDYMAHPRLWFVAVMGATWMMLDIGEAITKLIWGG